MDKRYLDLMRERPSWFENAEGGIVILTDVERIRCIEEKQQTRIGVIYEDEYIILLKDAVIFADGEVGTYIRTYHKNPGGVSVLVLCGDKVLMLKHFRHSLRRWLWETPRGFSEYGQSPLENAMRELREEIGIDGAEVSYLGELVPDAGIMGETITLYYTRIPDGKSIVTERHEGIGEVAFLTKAQLKELIKQGEIVDGITICALTYAELKGIL